MFLHKNIMHKFVVPITNKLNTFTCKTKQILFVKFLNSTAYNFTPEIKVLLIHLPITCLWLLKLKKKLVKRKENILPCQRLLFNLIIRVS